MSIINNINLYNIIHTKNGSRQAIPTFLLINKLMLQVAVLTAQSEVLGLTVDYYSIENPTSDETNFAYIYSSILILLSISLIFLNFVFYAGRKVPGMMRILLTNAIYSKVS